MSRQTKKPRLAIIPDEVSNAPGETEASAIRADYGVAMDGLRAFVRMGFRLMEVKARLPHGGYIPWCEQYLPSLRKSQIHRAKSIAEQIGAMLKCPIVGHLEELPAEVLEIIDASQTQKNLLANLHDFAESEDEWKARKQCEAIWEKKPGDRDEWEPLVLSGDIGYLAALRGMLGQAATKGQKKADPKAASIALPKALRTMTLHLRAFDTLSEHARYEFAIELEEMITHAPAPVRQMMLKALTEGGEA